MKHVHAPPTQTLTKLYRRFVYVPELAAGDGGEDGLGGLRVEVAGEDDGRVFIFGLDVVCEELHDVLALLVPEGGEEGAVARLQVRRRHAHLHGGVGPGPEGRREHHLKYESMIVNHVNYTQLRL